MPQINTLLDTGAQKETQTNTDLPENKSESKDKLLIIAIVAFGFLAIFSALIYALTSFGYWKGKQPLSPVTKTTNNQNTQVQNDNLLAGGNFGNIPSPINGTYTTKDQETIWTARRPLGVMINNHTEARPQSCLNNADIVYEAVAEGGITRLLAVFQTKDCEKLGPVRSARVYYEDWNAEYQGIYAHWGAAYQDPNDPSVTYPEADAYLKINELNMPDLDQMWVGDAAYFRVERPGKAIEHTGYTATKKLWEAYITKYPEVDWRQVPQIDSWKFKDDLKLEQRPAKGILEFDFWSTTVGYNVKWEYDPKTNSYRRYQGGELIKDAETQSEVMAKTVIVQFEKETNVGDKKNHLSYQTLGTGQAEIYRDGQRILATWSKQSSRSRTKYFDSAGVPVELNRGQIWVEIVPSGNTVSYQTN